MAEQQTPTFKLVLVGDGGTGKVRLNKDDDFFWSQTENAPRGWMPA